MGAKMYNPCIIYHQQAWILNLDLEPSHVRSLTWFLLAMSASPPLMGSRASSRYSAGVMGLLLASSRSWKSRSSQMKAGLKSTWPAADAAPLVTPGRHMHIAHALLCLGTHSGLHKQALHYDP